MKKNELYTQFIDELEETKNKLMSCFSEERGSREVRNQLYELLGVIENKKRLLLEPLILNLETV
jgi:hypothetical protein